MKVQQPSTPMTDGSAAAVAVMSVLGTAPSLDAQPATENIHNHVSVAPGQGLGPASSHVPQLTFTVCLY